MKQSTFSKPIYADWLAKQKAKTRPVKPKTSVRLKPKRVSKQTYYKELLAQNKWLNKIPLGSHGSTPLQKKLWKVTTDYVRIYDFITYGKCPSCNRPFTSWQEAQGGHYRAYSLCKGYKKFDRLNVFAQCAYCNSRMNEDKFEGGRIFSQNIVKRYGQSRLDLINTYTQGSPEKLEVPKLIEMINELLGLFEELDIKPDYYYKIAEYKNL